MLKAIPKGWFSSGFDVYDRGGARLGSVSLSNWRETASLEVGGVRYEANHKAGKKEFRLSREDGTTVLTAEKPSAWREKLHFSYGGNGYELSKESYWKRAFTLYRDDIGKVGSVKPGGMFERTWTAELPEELTPEAKVFVMWLVALLWRRQNAAAGSGGGAGAG